MDGKDPTREGRRRAPSQLEAATCDDGVRVRFDAYEVDEANARLARGGEPVALAPKPFAVLCALLRRPGSLFTKNELLDAAWGHQFVSESVLKTAISELRSALGDDARQPRYIETVSRRGYRFIGHAQAIATPAAAPVRAPSPAAARAQPIAGRGDALARLRAAWERACAGRPTFVWIAGDPGVGKTTLVDHFAASLGDVVVARGQCVEQYGTGEPYLSVLEALSELCRMDATVVDQLRAVAPSWLMQLPWLVGPEERETVRRELMGVHESRRLRELGEFIDRYTEKRPLLLVTEDLHWSGPATIHLIDHLARRRSKARLMWIATFRLADVIAHDHALKAVRSELRLHGLAEEIVLDPFSEVEVAEYVAKRLPTVRASPEFVRALYERTEGLPLFVAQIVDDLIARRVITEGDAAATAELRRFAIPENLASIIDHYLAGLTGDERVVLEAAAVCGVEFSIDAVAAALDRDLESVAAICDELARGRRWLVPAAADGGEGLLDPRYAFRHAVFRQVIYDRVGLITRSRLHRRVGATLAAAREAGRTIAETEIATHFELGGETMTAARHYAAAAEALLHVSPADAIQHIQRALAVLGGVRRDGMRDALELSLETLRGIATAQVLGLGNDEAKAALLRAFALLAMQPQHPMRGLLLHDLGFFLCMRAEYAEALALTERAGVASSDSGDPTSLLALSPVHGQVNHLRGRHYLAREWIERGLVAGASQDDSALQTTFAADARVELLGLSAMQLVHEGLVGQARARARDARTLARRLRQPMALAVALWFEGLVEVRLDNAERLFELADEMQTVVDEAGFAQGRPGCRWMRGWALARTTDPIGGHRLLREAYEENVRLGMRAGGSEILGYATEALVRAGDWAAAQDQLQEALTVARALDERVYLVQLLLLEATIADARGEPGAACTSNRRAVAEAREQQAPWLELIALVELCRRREADDDARRTLAALVDRLVEADATPAVRRARKILDRSANA